MTPVRKFTFWAAVACAVTGVAAAIQFNEVFWWALGTTLSTFLLIAGVKLTGV